MKFLLVLAAFGLAAVAASPLLVEPRQIPIQPRVVQLRNCPADGTPVRLQPGDQLRWRVSRQRSPFFRRPCGIQLSSTERLFFNIECSNFNIISSLAMFVEDALSQRNFTRNNILESVTTEGATRLSIRKVTRGRGRLSLSCLITALTGDDSGTTTISTSTAATTTTTSATTTTTTAATTTTTAATTTTTNPTGRCVQCGRTAPSNRIVGGSTTTIQEHPYQVGLVSGNVFCGGTLINSEWVVTAAHCTAGSSSGSFGIYLGGTPRDTRFEGQVVGVAQIINHPDYNSRNLDNDIALIRLDEPVSFTNSIYPACIPESDASFEGLTTTISGWGTIRYQGDQPDELKQAQVQTMSNGQCTSGSNNYPPQQITGNMICASFPNTDSCQGDSGGPMVSDEGFLVGVVSWGYECATSGYPGVYTRVTEYSNWINDKTGGNEPCTE